MSPAVRQRLEGAGRALARGREKVPAHLSVEWRPVPEGADEEWAERLWSFRRTVLPWMDATAPMAGQQILEVGTGPGASAAAMAEQGALVTGIDVVAEHLDTAAAMLSSMELEAELSVRNGDDLASMDGHFDQIVFWAVLEHMTIAERMAALAAAWARLDRGGLLTLVETPNRLWPYDSHTAFLPFFSWLPYELAYLYSSRSKREGFRELYGDEGLSEMAGFLRRGTGVSFHEFDLAIADHHELEVASSMQSWARSHSSVRRIGWKLSTAGRTERTLAAYAPGTDRAWLQPFLYLTLRKS